MLDLYVAFDTMDHSLLVDRLEKTYGVQSCALKWMKEYLTKRSHVVEIAGSSSQKYCVRKGVTQGSVLGPQLFLCYIKPLSNVLKKHPVSYHVYADDVQIYKHFKLGDMENFWAGMRCLQSCAADVRSWMNSNRLMLNDSKTELLVVAPKQHTESISSFNPTIQIGDANITPVECVKNLGCLFDQHMSMVPQVRAVCRSMYFHLHQIGQIRHYLTREARATAVVSLVLSRLDYNNGLLCELPQSVLNRLQVALNSAARLVMGIRRREHISPVLKSLHWLPVKERIQFKVLLITYKVFHNIGSPPGYLSAILEHYTPPRSLRSGSKDLLSVKKAKGKVGERAFQTAAPKYWNALSLHSRSATTISSFRNNLKTELFKEAHGD